MINFFSGSGIGCPVMGVGESEETPIGIAVGGISVGAKVTIKEGNNISIR